MMLHLRIGNFSHDDHKLCVFMFKLCISLEKIQSSAADTRMSTLFLSVSKINRRTVRTFTAKLFKLQISDMGHV